MINLYLLIIFPKIIYQLFLNQLLFINYFYRYFYYKQLLAKEANKLK